MFSYLPLDSGESLQLDFQYMNEATRNNNTLDPESIKHDTSSVRFVKNIVGTILGDREWHRNDDVMKQACQKDD